MTTKGVTFYRCPHCSFENIHPEEIARHIRYYHNVSKSDETGTFPHSEVNHTENSGLKNE